MLAAGTRLGPYEVISPLGAGGMGEVYRARDTKLGRDVAIKVVSDSFTHDPERVARFHSEAQLLAALNHPHIATIHGLEETATSSGQAALQFLVMELVEGDTLAERLRSGPIPVAEALRIARQVADALQAAHEKGIIHRDLKPANIALTAEGQVKVLDFGLAKALEAASAGDISISPTLSLAATQAGVILGTAAYMAPEQARGKPVDKRSDIWAFGCVLYEMLAGTRAFDGEDVAVVLASVIKGEPDWAALPAGVPTPIVTLLRSCLEKERRSRTADIGAATFVLDHAAQLVERVEVPVAALQPAAVLRPPLWRRAIPMAAAVAITALLAGAGVWLLTRPAPPAVVRTTITTSGSTALMLSGADRDLAITPDGSRVVYRGNNQLLVRALNQLEPTVLSGLGAPRGVFISPDGQWVGFFDGTRSTQESGHHGRAASDDHSRRRRRAARCHVGTGRDHHLRDGCTGDRPAACIGGRRRSHGAHEARSRARGRRSPLARVPAWRRGGPLHDHSGRRWHRERADCGAGSADRHVEGAHPWRQPRALRADGASGLRRRRDVARRGIRPRTAGGGRDACAGARGRGDDRIRRR